VETALTTALNGPVESPAEQILPERFEELMRRHQKRVYRVVFLLLKDRDAADTLTQECFLRAYQNLLGFRGDCREDTWLLRIAVNLARDHIRSRRVSFWKRLVGIEDESVAEPPASEPNQERTLLARAELSAVWSSLDGLSPQQREVFLLRFVEEMPLADIGTSLGLKVGTVKAHLFRALQNVRERMKEQQWR
jgi:RNA polymerase sigma-70 factor (ECF subfamily)